MQTVTGLYDSYTDARAAVSALGPILVTALSDPNDRSCPARKEGCWHFLARPITVPGTIAGSIRAIVVFGWKPPAALYPITKLRVGPGTIPTS